MAAEVYRCIAWVDTLKTAALAHVFPRSLHLRTKYPDSKLCAAKIVLKVVCQECHALHDFSECFHQRGSHITMKCCSECVQRRGSPKVALLRAVITSTGKKKLPVGCISLLPDN